MTDAVIIARNNTYGLTQDSALLKKILEDCGINVSTFTPKERGVLDWLKRRNQYDVTIHMERVFPTWLGASRRNVLVPNQERFPRRHLHRLRYVDLVLAKSRHAEDIFSGLGAPTEFAGFTSTDRRMEGVAKDWNRCLHLAGANTLKGTEYLVDLWRSHPEWPALVLVQKSINAPESVPGNIELHSGYIADDKLKQLQNECGVHLCPSRAEGWGHSIVEAMSCGALTLTTDAPPMNEHITEETGVLVPFSHAAPRHLGTGFSIDITALEKAILDIMAMPAAKKADIGMAARRAYETSSEAFARRLRGFDFAA